MEKKSRKTASKWEQASERALIAIWAEKMGKLRRCRKNGRILVEMSVELQRRGIWYSVVEIKTKMHNLTARYRKEKLKIGATGEPLSDWDLFAEMHTLLSPFESINTDDLVQDSINDITSILEVSCPLPSPTSAYNLPITPVQCVASPLPPLPVVADSPNPSSEMSLPSTSRPKNKKKDILSKVIKRIEESLDKNEEEMTKTTQKILEIEEEKKNILKEYVDREADVQKALIEFLASSTPVPIRLSRAFKCPEAMSGVKRERFH